MIAKILFLLTLPVFMSISALAQENCTQNTALDPIHLTNDPNIDAKFYHLDIEIDLDQAYISGKTAFIFTSTVDDLKDIHLDLDSNFSIDSVSIEVDSFLFENSDLHLFLNQNYSKNEKITFEIYYHGIPIKPGGYKGLRYETHGNNELVIATLSTPFLAHSWWPCKDGPGDKADSVYVDITIKDTTINEIPVIAVSNGMLENVISHNGKKTFQWRHRYPIVTYYVMAAISNYILVEDEYINPTDTFPLQYYTFAENKAQTIEGTQSMSDMLDFMTSFFGDYPFKNEKYGMTELGYYGAIENQTNTIINRMSTDYERVIIHELAHQWFADMITCETWHDGWLNEGFATYCEALFYEYQSQDFEVYQNYIQKKAFFDKGTVSLENIDDPFNIFQNIIYNKGAYVLHMLRGVLGDEHFFSALKRYAQHQDFQYQNANTQDFQDICEAESGLNLNYFFDQWIYDAYYPEYEYNYTDYQGSIFLKINQVQNQLDHREVFKMPMEILLKFKNGSDSTLLIFNEVQLGSYDFFIHDQALDSIILDPNNWILKKMKRNKNIKLAVANNTVFQNQIELYPNPSPSVFHFSKKVDLQVFDMNGKEIFPLCDDQLLDLKRYPAGIYICKDRISSQIFKVFKSE